MKILHISHGYLPESAGGIEIHLRDLMPAQRAADHDVKLLTGSLIVWEQAGLEELEIEGIPVFRLHRQDWFFDHYARSYNADAERMIVDVLAREEPDVVHVHQWIRLTNNIVELAEAEGIPAVVTLHDTYTSCPRAFRVHRDGGPCRRELSVENCVPCVPRFGHEQDDEVTEGVLLFQEQLRSELSRAHKVLVAMPTTAELLSETTGIPKSRYEVVGLPYRSRFHGAAAARPGDGVFRFGYWGNLNIAKGSHILIEAFRKVIAEVGEELPLQLHMLGSMASEQFGEELHAAADGLPVVFHGRYNSPELLAVGLDAAVFPALCFETFSLSLTECFELGLPSIVSDVGSLGIRAGAAALHVSPGDVAQLAAAMLRLAREPELRAKLCAQLPPLPPTPEAFVNVLEGIYAEATATPRPAGEASPGPERHLRFLAKQQESAIAAGRDPQDPTPPA